MGWNKFISLFRLYEETKYPEVSKAGFLLCFEGGFRASEAIVIRKDQCFYNDDAIVIRHAPVIKKKSPTYRNVLIKLDVKNPLGYEFRELIEDCEGTYLFPKHTPLYREYKPHLQSTRRTLYRRINEIGNLFPHSLRAYRAMMLVAERGFTVQNLVEWFSWSSADMAIHYTRTRDIAKVMGIKNLPLFG